MSLYTVAQADGNFTLATNLDSSSTEKANYSGLSVSSSQFGTVTQNPNSLTGNASYDFGSDGRVLHQWGASYGINNFEHEIVFRRSSAPASDVYLLSSLQTTSIQITSNGYIRATFNTVSYGGNSITGSVNLCDGKFHHIVVSYHNGTAGFRLYVDGVLIGTKSTLGNLNYSGFVNLGSYTNSSGASPSAYSEATIDFYAFYNGSARTTAQVDTFVANHMLEFADRTTTAEVSTASALAVDPAISTEIVIIETPATATADIGDIQVSNFDTPVMLDDYLATRSLEQWYKFDEVKKIHNYGSGGDAETAWAFYNETTTGPQLGIQGSGGLKLKGNRGAPNNIVQLAFGTNEPYSPEITDNEFSIGFWFKAESGFGAKDTNFITYQELFTDNNYQIGATPDGYIRFLMNHNGTTYTASSVSNNQTNWCDNNWHFVHARRSASGNTIKISIDNGTEISTATPGNNNSPAVGTAVFGLTGQTGANTKYAYVSHMFVTGYNTITSTERAAIMAAAAVPIQAAAGMVQPRVRFESAFNDLTNSYAPSLEYRLDDTTGTPTNFGSIRAFSAGINGEAITFGNASLNGKAYRFTNADTYLQGDWDGVDGLYSADNRQTASVVFKANGYTSFEQILFSAGMYGFIGAGITIAMSGSTGHLTARINQGFGPTDTDSLTTTINVGDNKWHHAVGVKDGSSFKLYLDGKEVATMSTAAVNLTDFGAWGVSAETKYNSTGTASKDTYIDEFALIPGALGANDVFDLYQAIQNQTEWTVSALAVDPTIAAGFGPTIAEPAMIVSAEFANVFPFIPPMLVDALFLNPNYEATKNTENLADPMTADAQGENPGWDIGENNQVLHMDASAMMPEAEVFVPGNFNSNPGIATAEMVDPAISSTLGALIVAQSIPVQAIFVSPPAYKLITDDIWYQKLYLQHSVVNGERWKTDNLAGSAGTSSASAFLKLFDDVTQSIGGANTNKIINNLPRSIVTDTPTDTSTDTQYAVATNAFQTATPTPVLEVGTFDDYERKAVRFRNIQFSIPENNYVSNNGYSLEFTFKSTKANQVMAQGFQQSFIGYQSATSSIGLIDGKLYATRATQGIGEARIFAHPDNTSIAKYSFVTAYGNKRIDDGAWHHIIIQYGFDGRVQFWIDGQLDIQFFADSNFASGAGIRPYIIGSNHSNTRWQSDFETSAWSYDAAFFVESDEVTDHYTASIKYEPVHAEPATATAEIAQESKAAGNRGRALMLYFWPTSSPQTGTPFGTGPYTSDESPDTLTTLDYFTAPPQEFEGWDVFPVDITGKWVSDLVKVEAYGGVENIGKTNFIQFVSQSQNTTNAPYALVNKRRTFRDPLTDAPRYIDLINDIDLSKFDMIMFKNYPNDPNEKDAFTGAEVVDAYFNLRESKIFEDFVKSLRAAVDTGISLMVANAQLALDLKIVDRVETVPDMDDNVGQGNYSDPYSPTQMFGIEGAADLPVPPEYDEPLGWEDTWKNNRTRIVNTHPDITDYPALVKTQAAYWVSTDEYRWGGADRQFAKYEHKDALAVGDEFLISTTGARANNNRSGYLATPFENVKAGKIITAFANTVRRGLDLIENPYRNYAQSIIIEPGDVLDGTQVGGKIYVNFTEEINKCLESGVVEFTSVYWVNYAYENGIITLETRDELLAQDFVEAETPYWSLNGMHLLQQRSGDFELDTNFNKAGVQKETVKVRKINKNGGLSFRSVPQGSVFFASTYSWQYPTVSFEVPSMPTRGFRWLSNREFLEGTVVRPQAFAATAEMPNATEIVDKFNDFAAQSMVATATLPETNFTSGITKILVLPMEANATIVKPGSTIAAPTMVANAGMFANSRSNVASEDQVVLQIIHVDPILYIREDVIK